MELFPAAVFNPSKASGPCARAADTCAIAGLPFALRRIDGDAAFEARLARARHPMLAFLRDAPLPVAGAHALALSPPFSVQPARPAPQAEAPQRKMPFAAAAHAAAQVAAQAELVLA